MDVGMRDLELFHTLTEEPHFTRAAAVAGVSQPFLSRAVARLERALGTILVERTTRTVGLTPAGERLRDELAVILPQLEAAIRSVKESDILRLGFTWLLPSTLTRDLIGRLEESTGCRVQLIRCDDRWGGVTEGSTHAAIVYSGGGMSSAVRTVALATEDRLVAVGRDHPLARRRRLAWSELASYPLVVNAGSGTVGAGMWPAGAQPDVALSSRNYDEGMETVAAGRGFGVVPASARLHPHPGIRYIAVPDAPQVSLELVLPAHTTHPLADALERLVKEGLPGA
jgi:DNA-binding transcriptional LysR family regulator